MQEGLLMTQADRDRLVTLKKAKKKLITQGEAAEELGVSRRHVKRLLKALKKRGDKAVIHGLRGKASNRRIADATGEMPPTQIGRGLRELGVVWIAAHSPQAKGRVERNFKTAQDRLVKGLRVAGVKTIEQANQYLEEEYMVWWERELTVEPANSDDAHRPLDKSQNLAASLSHVETRQVRNDYTLRLDNELYQIELQAVVSGLRGANVSVEQRLDGALAVRYGEKYLPVTRCAPAEKQTPAVPAKPTGKRRQPRRGSDWNQNFDLKKAPKVWQAAQESGCRQEQG
jgi:hypothetical protein